jgi:dipeptidyl aminopeptidase/acylaminoacyl peptidase
VGLYPEEKEKYIRYSPAYSADKISSPVLILQGDEDKIVPPSQSEVIYNALVKNGIPTAYIIYKGEQHGFRTANNIIHSLESELYFYCKIFGLPEPIGIPSIEIENLKS